MQRTTSARPRGQKPSLEELVLAELEARTPWNKIAKKFRISTKTIQEIKEGNQGGSTNEGRVAAQAFELFERGKKPIRAIIQLGQAPELVEELYEQWAEMKGALLIPKATKEEIFNEIIGSTGYRVDNLEDLRCAIIDLVSDHEELKKFTYPCNVCGKPIQARSESEWKWVIKEGCISIWGHSECHGRGR